MRLLPLNWKSYPWPLGAFKGMLITPPPKKNKAQVISPTACGALFSACTTPQPSENLVEPLWSPDGTLVEPWWNPRGTLPQGRPGPPRSLSGLRPQSFQLLGKKERKKKQKFLRHFEHLHGRRQHQLGEASAEPTQLFQLIGRELHLHLAEIAASSPANSA